LDAPTQYALAYVLSSTAGVRAFVTLLAISLAMHWGLLPPPGHQFAWLASDGALAVLLVASILEVLGDKVPLVDHGLHALHTIAKPLAGAVIAGAIVAPENDPSAVLLGVLGGANALAIRCGADPRRHVRRDGLCAPAAGVRGRAQRTPGRRITGRCRPLHRRIRRLGGGGFAAAERVFR
jgi:hypothetical protein